jgi:predicted membrane metal-binding protein
MEISRSSNKNFGIVFFIVFIIIAFWPLLDDKSYRLWAILISLIFLILGLINSKLLTPLNTLWFKLGILLGKIVSPLVMGIIFFVVVTPTALLMKLFKKDVLNLTFNKKNSYWIEKDKQKSTMKNQF